MSFGASVETFGPIAIGNISMTVRTGDIARQFQNIGSRLRTEVRRTMGVLVDTAKREMISRAPRATGRLASRIFGSIKEGDTWIRGSVRPLGSRQTKMQAYALEGGFSGNVKQHVRRPANLSRPRTTQASLASRARSVMAGKSVVRVMAYPRTQRAQPFVRPVYEHMAKLAEVAFEAAMRRAVEGA